MGAGIPNYGLCRLDFGGNFAVMVDDPEPLKKKKNFDVPKEEEGKVEITGHYFIGHGLL